MLHYKLLFIAFIILQFNACGQVDKNINTPPQKLTTLQDSILNQTMRDASKYSLFSIERQQALDKGLKRDSTIAYLWQQKAMPLFKQRKYQLGMSFIDKAVKFDKFSWQEYRAFIKCIFAKTYAEAIADFEDSKKTYGNRIVMDHSYDFYIALCQLQLNEFTKAETLLDSDISKEKNKHGEDWVHYLDLFYAGIAKYELKKFDAAIAYFDRALVKYPTFAEGLYYKSACLRNQGKIEAANAMYELAVQKGKGGNTINEDNVIYETYPYAINWIKWMN